METTSETSNIQAELVSRHRSTSRIVVSLLVGTVLLSLIAFVGKRFLVPKPDPMVDTAWKIIIVIFGLGSIVYRRTKFSAMRLRDVGGVGGPIGLLKTLAGTTVQVAIIGAAIALTGFVATLLTGNDRYTYGAGVIAIVVLLYCLPTRASWRRALEQFVPSFNGPVDEPANQ